MRQLFTLAFLMSGGCLSTSVTGLGTASPSSLSSATSSGGVSSTGASSSAGATTSAAGSSSTNGATSSGASTSGRGSSTGGASTTTGGASTGKPLPCGDAGLLCGTDDFCYQGSNCLPLVDCTKGGGYLFAQGDCLIDGGTLGACCGQVCVGLSTAMTMLKSGWVIIGSTPSTDGTTRTKTPGGLIVLNSNGDLQTVWTGPNINGPWGNVATLDNGNTATLFVSMAGFDVPGPDRSFYGQTIHFDPDATKDAALKTFFFLQEHLMH